MMTAQAVIDAARAEIGVLEQPPGSNRVKYNTAYYGRAVSGINYPWCCVFVWWVFKAAGASKLYFGGGKTANCSTLMHYYQIKRQAVSQPLPGDLLFYQLDDDVHADHVGIVETVDEGRITAVEGNTGDAVRRVIVDRSRLITIARPAYENAAATGDIDPTKTDTPERV